MKRKFRNGVRVIAEYLRWKKRSFTENAPHLIKIGVLKRHGIPEAVWVETGTYLGDTTRILSRMSPTVYSIEPSRELFEQAQQANLGTNVELINATSEEVFPSLLEKLGGCINFWLDGHYSEGNTFLGESETPIEMELAAIEANIRKFDSLAIFVDDFRCFVNWSGDPRYQAYPPPSFLANWAEKNNLRWTVEHDIFIMKK